MAAEIKEFQGQLADYNMVNITNVNLTFYLLTIIATETLITNI